MRVLAWNTHWNSSVTTLEDQCDAAVDLGAEIAFFSEWSPSPSRQSNGVGRRSNGYLRGPALATRGLPHLAQEHVSDRSGDGKGWSQLAGGCPAKLGLSDHAPVIVDLLAA